MTGIKTKILGLKKKVFTPVTIEIKITSEQQLMELERLFNSPKKHPLFVELGSHLELAREGL